jgi:hypothetical protein
MSLITKKISKIISSKEVNRKDCLMERDQTCSAPLRYRASGACQVISVTFRTEFHYSAVCDMRHCPQKVIQSAGYNQVPKLLHTPGHGPFDIIHGRRFIVIKVKLSP